MYPFDNMVVVVLVLQLSQIIQFQPDSYGSRGKRKPTGNLLKSTERM